MTTVSDLQDYSIKVRDALLAAEDKLGAKSVLLADFHALLDGGATLLASYFNTDVKAFGGGIPKDPPTTPPTGSIATCT